jgi:hypothetical protein
VPDKEIKQNQQEQHKTEKGYPPGGNIEIDQVAHEGKIGYGMEQDSSGPQKGSIHPGAC